MAPDKKNALLKNVGSRVAGDRCFDVLEADLSASGLVFDKAAG